MTRGTAARLTPGIVQGFQKVALKRWIRAALLTVGGATLAPIPLRAQVPPLPLATAPSDSPVDAQAMIARDLSELNATLLRPENSGPRDETPQQRREEAARRLLSRSSPQAAKFVLDALQDPAASHDVKTAIARAIADAPDPNPAFIAPLLPLLGTDRTLCDAVARALARFSTNPTARERLISFAQNAAQPPAMRIGAIRALGVVISRDTSDALIALVSDPKSVPAIQNAAADALLEMTGEATANHDPQRWKQWQAANANKPEIVWRADILSAREKRTAHDDRANADFINEMKQILDEQYQQATPAAQGVMLMRLLNSPDAHARLMGVQRVIDAHANAKSFSPLAPKRLEELVGDSDTAVRFMVAQAINSINPSDALTAILTQLPQESDPEVKVAQIDALAPMKQLAAVPILRQLLHDPSIKVATHAARALAQLGLLLKNQNPALMHDIAAELWQAGIQRQGEPGGLEFRLATIETIGALGDRGFARQLLALLNVDTDDRIRSAALHALGAIGDRDTAFQIAQWLRIEPNPTVRMDALRALGNTSTFEGAADTLHDFMSTKTEPDENVRKRAWEVFQSMLPKATVQGLSRWQSEFLSDPARRLPVLLALNDKLQESMSWEDLALSRQNTGETYLALKDPARAAVVFGQALDYWQKRKVANQVTVTLVKQLLQSLLAAKEYAQAVDFTGKQIAIDRAMQTLVGPVIRDAAENLHNEALKGNDSDKMKDALSLIDAALKAQPPLDERYQTDLRQFQADLQQRIKTPPKP